MKSATFLVIPACLLFGASTPLLADDDKSDNFDLESVVVTIDQAISIANNEVTGTVVSSELESENGSLVWEVEVVDTSNKRFEIEIDASTGDVLEVEIEDD